MNGFSFRKKVFILCLMVSLVPVTVLGVFCYKQISYLLISREKTVLKETLLRENDTLNSKRDAYLNAMNYIIWNEGLRRSLANKYSGNAEMYLAYREVFDPLFATIRAFNSEFKRITIYTNNPINPHGQTLRPLDELSQMPWYREALNKTTPMFVASLKDKTLYLVCQIYMSRVDYTTILLIDIDYDSAFNALNAVFNESYGIVITNKDGETVYAYENIAYRPGQVSFEPDSNEYVTERISNTFINWSMSLYRPMDTISASANGITKVVLIIILCCLIGVVLLSSFLSRLLVRPLEMLVENMDQIENDAISVKYSYDGNNEMGRLFRSFQDMVVRLRYLIDEVLKSKIAQQEHEMKALQAQINPHFLYNSLSLINGKALMTGQEDISRMAQSLATFYRTSLNKGRHIATVRDELENVRSYLAIQFIMHGYSFDVNYDVDDEALACTVVSFLLQPIIENAIMHGIDHKETEGRGLLTISCKATQHEISYEISDNGPGISADRLSTILTSDSSGYGIQNVQSRIQLFYGHGYGLRYQSKPDVGTTVYLRLPKRLPERPVIPSPTP